MSGTEPDVPAADPSLWFSSLISAGASSVQEQDAARLSPMPHPTGHRQALLFESVMLRKTLFPGSQLGRCWAVTSCTGARCQPQRWHRSCLMGQDRKEKTPIAGNSNTAPSSLAFETSRAALPGVGLQPGSAQMLLQGQMLGICFAR